VFQEFVKTIAGVEANAAGLRKSLNVLFTAVFCLFWICSEFVLLMAVFLLQIRFWVFSIGLS
jgi:hypothetical protein